MKISASLSGYGISSAIYTDRDFSLYNVPCSHEYEQERISVLASLIEGKIDCVIATPDAAMQRTVPKMRLSAIRYKLSVGSTVDLKHLASYLFGFGYRRVTSVDGVGQYAVRGGIFDVYPPNTPAPVRIELFGDDTFED